MFVSFYLFTIIYFVKVVKSYIILPFLFITFISLGKGLTNDIAVCKTKSHDLTRIIF